jgi:hypothetical protein
MNGVVGAWEGGQVACSKDEFGQPSVACATDCCCGAAQ